MNFGGDEIYFKQEPTLSGKTYGEVLLAYEDSSVMGFRKVDGTIMLNPPMGARLRFLKTMTLSSYPGSQVFRSKKV